MKELALAICIASIAPAAFAETIAPCDAAAHIGQIVPVEGPVDEAHHAASGRATFLDMGGQHPNNCLAIVMFSDDQSKFPNVDALEAKTVDITGMIKSYRGRPEIILNDPPQLKTK